MFRSKSISNREPKCQTVVIWIDWYPYHVARFTGLQSAFGHQGEVVGIELVGGIGVHTGLKFREDLPAGLPVETLRPESSWREVNKVHLAASVWKRLSELDPETVLVPGYYTLPALAAAIWARSHRRLSILMTETTEQDHTRSAWKEALKSRLVRSLFDWAITGGRAHVRYLRQLNFPEDRIASFYDVVGNEKMRDATTALRTISTAADHDLPSGYFLYIGRLAPEKNVGGLLQAWIAYRQNGGIRPLVLVGDGPESAALRDIAARSEFAREVHFTGHKSSREVRPFLAFADCFVLPSKREPWGLVVNEAMAASLPVLVSSRCGCAEDLVQEGCNGFTFDPDSLQDLTECLQAFDGMSNEILTRMGQASADRITAYSPGNFGVQVSEIAARGPRKSGVVNSSSTERSVPSAIPRVSDVAFETRRKTGPESV